jgi:hypothetical protein
VRSMQSIQIYSSHDRMRLQSTLTQPSSGCLHPKVIERLREGVDFLDRLQHVCMSVWAARVGVQRRETVPPLMVDQ